jgi:predicted metal-dependent HD superfamily phosphohydrolase
VSLPLSTTIIGVQLLWSKTQRLLHVVCHCVCLLMSAADWKAVLKFLLLLLLPAFWMHDIEMWWWGELKQGWSESISRLGK